MNAPGMPVRFSTSRRIISWPGGERVARLDRVDEEAVGLVLPDVARRACRCAPAGSGSCSSRCSSRRASRAGRSGRGGSRSRRCRRPSCRSRRRPPPSRRRTSSRSRGSASSSAAPRRRAGTSRSSSGPSGVIGPEPERRALLDLLAQRAVVLHPFLGAAEGAEDRADVVDGAEVAVDRARALLRRPAAPRRGRPRPAPRARGAAAACPRRSLRPVAFSSAGITCLAQLARPCTRGAPARACRRPGRARGASPSGSRTPRAAARTTS